MRKKLMELHGISEYELEQLSDYELEQLIEESYYIEEAPMQVVYLI